VKYNYKPALLGSVLILTGPMVAAPVWATDYSGVSCNDKELRRNLIELYDQIDDEENAIDTYDQVTIKAGKDVLVCEGIYELSDKTKWKLRFEQGVNSLGDPVFEFIPLVEY